MTDFERVCLGIPQNPFDYREKALPEEAPKQSKKTQIKPPAKTEQRHKPAFQRPYPISPHPSDINPGTSTPDQRDTHRVSHFGEPTPGTEVQHPMEIGGHDYGYETHDFHNIAPAEHQSRQNKQEQVVGNQEPSHIGKLDLKPSGAKRKLPPAHAQMLNAIFENGTMTTRDIQNFRTGYMPRPNYGGVLNDKLLAMVKKGYLKRTRDKKGAYHYQVAPRIAAELIDLPPNLPNHIYNLKEALKNGDDDASYALHDALEEVGHSKLAQYFAS